MRRSDTTSGRRGGDSLGGGRGRPRTAANAVVALTLFACGAALALSVLEPDAVAPMRGVLSRSLTPVVSVAADAAGLVGTPVRALIGWAGGSQLSAEDAAAQAQRATLQARIASLEHENRDLKALTGFAQGGKGSMVSARVVMRSSSPLSHTVVIDAGSVQGVHEGLPVVAGLGLIGRVVQTYEDDASVMLLTDRLSRVPVAVGSNEVRAVLVGAGDRGARLEFLSPGAVVGEGDAVTTSGVGGIFPRGLVIGVVARTSDTPEVRLTAADDDPLVVGVLSVDGPGYEAVTTISTKAKKTIGQAPNSRDAFPAPGLQGRERHDD